MIRRIPVLVISTILFFPNLSFARMLETKQPAKTAKERKADNIEERLQKLSEQLKLNDEQKARVREILTRSKEEIVKVLDDAGGRIEKINNNTDDEIESVLTDEQKSKFSGEAKKEAEVSEEKWLKVFK